MSNPCSQAFVSLSIYIYIYCPGKACTKRIQSGEISSSGAMHTKVPPVSCACVHMHIAKGR